jgi:hypothetical protein
MNAGCFTNSSRITVPNYPHASIIQTFENNILQPASPSKTKIFEIKYLNLQAQSPIQMSKSKISTIYTKISKDMTI